VSRGAEVGTWQGCWEDGMEWDGRRSLPPSKQIHALFRHLSTQYMVFDGSSHGNRQAGAGGQARVIVLGMWWVEARRRAAVRHVKLGGHCHVPLIYRQGRQAMLGGD
jgi:hypothetical protein